VADKFVANDSDCGSEYKNQHKEGLSMLWYGHVDDGTMEFRACPRSACVIWKTKVEKTIESRRSGNCIDGSVLISVAEIEKELSESAPFLNSAVAINQTLHCDASFIVIH
jgi:hypothetical protein